MIWSPLPTLVTLDQAIAHGKIPVAIVSPTTAELDDLELKLEIATELVLDYVSQRIDDTADAWLATVQAWTDTTAPRRVKGAILAQFLYLYRRRGDDVDVAPAPVGASLCPDAQNMVYRLGDPSVGVPDPDDA